MSCHRHFNLACILLKAILDISADKNTALYTSPHYIFVLHLTYVLISKFLAQDNDFPAF